MGRDSLVGGVMSSGTAGTSGSSWYGGRRGGKGVGGAELVQSGTSRCTTCTSSAICTSCTAVHRRVGFSFSFDLTRLKDPILVVLCSGLTSTQYRYV